MSDDRCGATQAAFAFVGDLSDPLDPADPGR